MYWRTCSSSNPTVETAYPRAQKCSPEKFRSLPYSRAVAIALFPLRNPITEATGCLGGMAMHMCRLSGIRCPSRIWHSLCRANPLENLSQLTAGLPEDCFPPSFGHKHNMILAVPFGLG